MSAHTAPGGLLVNESFSQTQSRSSSSGGVDEYSLNWKSDKSGGAPGGSRLAKRSSCETAAAAREFEVELLVAAGTASCACIGSFPATVPPALAVLDLEWPLDCGTLRDDLITSA